LVFPGSSLGLGGTPRYVGGRKRSRVKEKYREHHGGTAARVTGDQADDRDARPLLA
jgi:hypothetical protein